MHSHDGFPQSKALHGGDRDDDLARHDCEAAPNADHLCGKVEGRLDRWLEANPKAYGDEEKDTQVQYERLRSVEHKMSLRPCQKRNSEPEGKKHPAHGSDLSPQAYSASTRFKLERHRSGPHVWCRHS